MLFPFIYKHIHINWVAASIRSKMGVSSRGPVLLGGTSEPK